MKMCAPRHSGQLGTVIETPPRLPRLTQRSALAIGRLRHCVGVAPPGSTWLIAQTLTPFG
jgi:hypothetical protein